ncbi:helix-turn-helix transcriptional regulator [Micromonospora sp. C51]|uniref:helix-turn-helix domain-containing protein n=1 Tax=Micromonospora sp. C51 TaxID=2824879 RepID=UPI001B35A36D|nr:helix-turn-helix domain-containing protein [Micromonospora sp. C51]MBQ1047113.1 helix-turn-helix transcriptional regulator [Micromonospora sp. C51]
MTGRGEVPIGRRVAQWRTRRRMTQQALADRLGKSKSWVDKVERGARALDKFSMIRQIADVLRVEPAVLIGERPAASVGTVPVDGLDGVRTALARYGTFPLVECQVPVVQVRRQVGHAWLTYQHARYPQVVRLLPGLLDAARGIPRTDAELLMQVYRIASSVLVKLDEPDLAWLAADRAATVAGGDALWAGAAAISVGQALRAAGRERLALTSTLDAAVRLVPLSPAAGAPDPTPGATAVGGTLLLQAALAAASCGEARQAGQLLDRAAALADASPERAGGERSAGEDAQRTCFGPVVVESARVLVAVERGEAAEAVCRHEVVIRRDGWRRLPAEYRGAYLVDAARAYLLAGDLLGAGRMLVAADAVAPAEVRSRSSARTLLAEIARGRPAPAGVARLSTLAGLTR